MKNNKKQRKVKDMELKNRYQYTYFIHTFLINKSRYGKYISRLLKDKKFNLRIFEKQKGLSAGAKAEKLILAIKQPFFCMLHKQKEKKNNG